jgi:hypothetical protein
MDTRIIDKTLIETIIADIENRQIDQVETAGLMYLEYAELARYADRGKSRAKRQLKGYPPGEYGDVQIKFERVNREYPDMDRIAEIFAAHGLGPVPVKAAEPTLRVSFVDREGNEVA